MTDMEIEKEIVAKGKTAARVTPERIQSVIRAEHYFTAFDGSSGAPAKRCQLLATLILSRLNY